MDDIWWHGHGLSFYAYSEMPEVNSSWIMRGVANWERSQIGDLPPQYVPKYKGFLPAHPPPSGTLYVGEAKAEVFHFQILSLNLPHFRRMHDAMNSSYLMENTHTTYYVQKKTRIWLTSRYPFFPAHVWCADDSRALWILNRVAAIRRSAQAPANVRELGLYISEPEQKPH